MPSAFHNIYFQNNREACAESILLNPRGQKVMETQGLGATATN